MEIIKNEVLNLELNLKKNLSIIDRSLRIVIGILLIILVYSKILNGWLGTFAIIIAISQFIEGFLGY